MSHMELTIKLLSKNAKLPIPSSPNSPSYEITISESAFLEADEVKELHTGLGMFLQQKDVCLVILEKRDVFLKYSTHVIEGVIDTEQNNEVIIVAKNLSREPVFIPEGTTIGEILFVNVLHPCINEASHQPISNTEPDIANNTTSSDEEMDFIDC